MYEQVIIYPGSGCFDVIHIVFHQSRDFDHDFGLFDWVETCSVSKLIMGQFVFREADAVFPLNLISTLLTTSRTKHMATTHVTPPLGVRTVAPPGTPEGRPVEVVERAWGRGWHLSWGGEARIEV